MKRAFGSFEVTVQPLPNAECLPIRCWAFPAHQEIQRRSRGAGAGHMLSAGTATPGFGRLRGHRPGHGHARGAQGQLRTAALGKHEARRAQLSRSWWCPTRARASSRVLPARSASTSWKANTSTTSFTHSLRADAAQHLHARNPRKAIGRVARPPVGVARAQPRRRGNPPHRVSPRSMPGLPGGGWPRHGLIEILTPQPGVGELYLLLPALAALSRLTPARWCTWVSPPHEPFAPALAAHGVALDRMLVVRTHLPLWAHEQALRSGACEVALAWLPRAARAPSAGCSSRPSRAVRSACCIAASGSRAEPSPAMLRVLLEPLSRCGQARRAREPAQEPRRQPRAHRAQWAAAAA